MTTPNPLPHQAVENLLFNALNTFFNSDEGLEEKGLTLAEEVENIYHDVVNHRLGWVNRLPVTIDKEVTHEPQ